MYQIYADGILIYDSTLDDYKIGKGQITLEAGKSGSFVFSVYPEHPYYGRFVQLKTVITVYKNDRIVFRGRVLQDKTDYWNCKTVTCEGELGFLQDSVVRPFSLASTPETLFQALITGHNAQVDGFKNFQVGEVTVTDPRGAVIREGVGYQTTLAAVKSWTVDSDLGGCLYITHGDDGKEELPTLHYLADYPATAEQTIEFGVNLKDYAKTTKADSVATAVIPLGTEVGSDGQRLTIKDVNDGVDYLFDPDAVALRGWVFQTAVWEDITIAQTLKEKGREWLDNAVKQAVTIELTALDLSLLDRSIESYKVCDYVRVKSEPHGFDATMLCTKQTMDLLDPENDAVTLGYETATMTSATTDMADNVESLGKKMSSIKQDAESIRLSVSDLGKDMSTTLRLTSDGLKITDADGNVVEIDGQQLKAGSVLANIITAGILQSGDGKTFRLDLDRGTFSMIGSGQFQSADGTAYIEVENNSLVLYGDSGTGEIIKKLQIGFTQSAGVAYPYIQLGSGGDGNDPGLIKKFMDGVYIGTGAAAKDAAGDFAPQAGYAGVFVNTIEGRTYVVDGDTMKDIYTGDAIARFG